VHREDAAQNDPGLRERNRTLLLLGFVGLAFAVRTGAGAVGWNGYALDFLHFSTALDPYTNADQPLWTTRIGLHPPQYAFLIRGLIGLGCSAGALLAIYAAISAATVGLGIRAFQRQGAPLAAGVFGLIAALSPLQAYYSWQLTNYVLLSCVGIAWFGLLWDIQSDRTSPVRWLILPLALAMTHLHLLGMTLVAASLLPLVIWRRRVEATASLLALVAAIPVILPLLAHLSSYQDSDGAAARISPGYEGLGGLARGYAEQYGDGLSLAGLLALSAIAIVLLLRSRRPQDRGLLTAGALVLGLATAATLAGVTNPRQGQYWLLASLLHCAVLALSFERAGRRLRLIMGLLLMPWLLGAGVQALNHHLHFTPSPSLEARAEYWLIDTDAGLRLGTPELPKDIGTRIGPLPADLLSSAQAALAQAAAGSDIILYIDETWWASDTPRRTDPFFAAFDPSDVRAVLPQPLQIGAPSQTGYRYPWRIFGKPLEIVTTFPRDTTSARAGELATELHKQLGAGKTVLIAMVLIDPTDNAPAVAPLIENTTVLEDLSVGPIRLLRLGLKAATEQPTDPQDSPATPDAPSP